MSDAIEADRLKRIRSHIGQSIVREIETVTLSTADALFLHSAALTAYEAAKGGGVKPLEWGQTSYGIPEAVSIVDVYRIMSAANGGYSVVCGGLHGRALRKPDGLTNFATEAEAKAAAQADYENRIRSALASPASGERDAWAGSAPFITSESGGGEYAVRVKVHSMDELHAAHTIVLKAFGAKL